MAKCRICGRAVTSAPMYHRKCVTERLDKLTDEACKDICRYTAEKLNERDMVDSYCLMCPLVEILELLI